MDVVESLRIGWRSIRDHTLRSTLTTLGVIIGVAAVITFVTLGASLQADIVQAVAGDNTDVMYVSAGTGGQTDIPGISGNNRPVFTEHDIRRIRQLEDVESVVPTAGMSAGPVTYRNDSVGRQWVTITGAEYFEVKGHRFVAGGPFVEGRREVVLNRRAARMFDENVSVGQEITITRAATGEEINATVAGIVAEPTDGQPSFVPTGGGQPAIYAPPDPFYDRTVVSPATGREQQVYGRLLVVAGQVDEVEVVKARVLTYLTESSDARILKPDGFVFEVTTYEQLVNRIEQISRTFTTYITGVTVISLIVGAIGIANIMLVSVTERTREIGIMKAVGARGRDVLELFLVESVLLGLLGAVLGVLVGFGGGYLATVLIGLPFRFQATWAVLAVVVGILVGIAAGVYPAWNAARIDPIEALRRE